MKELNALISSIRPPNPAAEAQARQRWAALAKPLGGLGELEEHIVRVAALTGSADVHLGRRTLVVFCADNGVTAQGVTQCDSAVTASVAAALGRGESTVSYLARAAGCDVRAVDVGILDAPPLPGVLSRRIENGTGDITRTDAMTRPACVQAILTGAELAQALHDEGCRLLLSGEMGIGNTTTTSAVASVLLQLPPAAVTGRGAGLSQAGLTRKIAAVERALARSRPDPDDIVGLLAKVGGLDLAALCGFYLGCAACRIPVLLDGVITSAAALCAVRLCPDAVSAMLASHVSAEPAGRRLLSALGLSPLIAAGLHMGEGTGAVAALPLLDLALAVYHSGHTFQHLGIEPYLPQP